MNRTRDRVASGRQSETKQVKWKTLTGSTGAGGGASPQKPARPPKESKPESVQGSGLPELSGEGHLLWKRGATHNCSLLIPYHQATHVMFVICLTIRISLQQRFSKCGQDLPAAATLPGNLSEIQVLTLTATKSEVQGVGVPSNLRFHKNPGRFWRTMKSESHWSVGVWWLLASW